MAVKILFVDIRDTKQVMNVFDVSWRRGICAKEAVLDALKEDISNKITRDLNENSPELIISWLDEVSGKHSAIGGVGDLDWEIPDKSILTIVYENRNTTEQQIDSSSDWMIQNSGIK